MTVPYGEFDPDMPKQIDLIQSVPWKALIILDECRADKYIENAGPCAVVESPGSCTRDWIRANGKWFVSENVLYYTANGIPVREDDHQGWGIEFEKVYETAKQPCGVKNSMAVHPWVMAYIVAEEMRNWIGGKRRFVVHFIQPHSPRTVSSYPESITLVNKAATWLAGIIGGLCVITSDHGTLFGEGGRRGHPCEVVMPELRKVPWVVLDGGTAVERTESEEKALQANLKMLGYV